MDARDGYAKLRSPLLRCLARSPLLAVAAHWALQSLLYMDRTERCAKLGLDLALALLVRLLVAPWLPDLAAWAAAVVAAHTANFFLNGHLWGVLKHYGFVRHSRAAFAGYVEGFLARAAREPAIDSVWICGSLSREAWSPASDLDVRLLRRPGVANGARACWFLLRERSRALCARFPLDAYVVDSRQGLLERGISSAGQAVGHASRPDVAHASTARTGPNLRRSAQSADGDSPPRRVNSHMSEPFSFAQALRHIAWDLRVNRGLRWDNLRAMLLLVEFRLEQYVYRTIGRPGHPLRPAWHACRFAGSVYQWLLCNSNLPGTASIGPGLRLPHPQGIIVAGTADVGAFCTIYQHVSVAWSGFHPTVPGLPRIGDGVLLGAGAIVLGEVTIGAYVLVGAGTTVTRSVPAYARVTGPPPTIAPRVPSAAAAVPGSERHLRDPYSIWR